MGQMPKRKRLQRKWLRCRPGRKEGERGRRTNSSAELRVVVDSENCYIIPLTERRKRYNIRFQSRPAPLPYGQDMRLQREELRGCSLACGVTVSSTTAVYLRLVFSTPDLDSSGPCGSCQLCFSEKSLKIERENVGVRWWQS